MTRAFVVAVDGPVAAGKGTLARRLAESLGLRHLDSGMLYRAVAARLLEEGGDPADEARAAAAARALAPDDLGRDGLRDQRIGRAASELAAHAAVRAALLAFQRAFAREPPGAAIDGRDIGAIVCPEADVKLYVTASLEERARRRRDELAARGAPADLAAVAAEIAERDRRDMERAQAPLRRAEDAVLLDTTALDPDEALRAALDIARERLIAAGGAIIQASASAPEAGEALSRAGPRPGEISSGSHGERRGRRETDLETE